MPFKKTRKPRKAKTVTIKTELPKNKYRINSTSMEAKAEPLIAGQSTTPRLFYTEMVFNEIKYLVQKCTKEVCWFGAVEKMGNDYLVTQIFVPKQKVTAASAEIDASDLSDIALELEDPSSLYYWGHSHVNMDVRPSGTDEQQFTEYLNDCDVMIRGIYNKAGKTKVDIADTKTGILHQCVENGPMRTPLSAESQAKIDAWIKDNVEEENIFAGNNRYRGATHWPSHYQSNNLNTFGNGPNGGAQPNNQTSANPFIVKRH